MVKKKLKKTIERTTMVFFDSICKQRFSDRQTYSELVLLF